MGERSAVESFLVPVAGSLCYGMEPRNRTRGLSDLSNGLLRFPCYICYFSHQHLKYKISPSSSTLLFIYCLLFLVGTPPQLHPQNSLLKPSPKGKNNLKPSSIFTPLKVKLLSTLLFGGITYLLASLSTTSYKWTTSLVESLYTTSCKGLEEDLVEFGELSWGSERGL